MNAIEQLACWSDVQSLQQVWTQLRSRCQGTGPDKGSPKAPQAGLGGIDTEEAPWALHDDEGNYCYDENNDYNDYNNDIPRDHTVLPPAPLGPWQSVLEQIVATHLVEQRVLDERPESFAADYSVACDHLLQMIQVMLLILRDDNDDEAARVLGSTASSLAMESVSKKGSRVWDISADTYTEIGEALILALLHTLGRECFTTEMEHMWISFYNSLANSLLSLAEDPILEQSQFAFVSSAAESEHSRSSSASSVHNSVSIDDDIFSTKTVTSPATVERTSTEVTSLYGGKSTPVFTDPFYDATQDLYNQEDDSFDLLNSFGHNQEQSMHVSKKPSMRDLNLLRRFSVSWNNPPKIPRPQKSTSSLRPVNSKNKITLQNQLKTKQNCTIV